jgi:hypothetical protein
MNGADLFFVVIGFFMACKIIYRAIREIQENAVLRKGFGEAKYNYLIHLFRERNENL